MRRHVDVGAEIVASTESLREAAPLVLASHEWFGGGGYPQKLAGTAIPLASRIIAVVDAYDAMTQDRPIEAASIRPKPSVKCSAAARRVRSRPSSQPSSPFSAGTSLQSLVASR